MIRNFQNEETMVMYTFPHSPQSEGGGDFIKLLVETVTLFYIY